MRFIELPPVRSGSPIERYAALVGVAGDFDEESYIVGHAAATLRDLYCGSGRPVCPVGISSLVPCFGD
jgi:hypothetical protein